MIPTTHRLFAVISGESTSLKKLHQTANLKRNKKTSSKPAFWIQAARFFGSKPFKLAIFWNWTQRLTFFEGIKPCLKPPSGRLRVFSAPVGFAWEKPGQDFSIQILTLLGTIYISPTRQLLGTFESMMIFVEVGIWIWFPERYPVILQPMKYTRLFDFTRANIPLYWLVHRDPYVGLQSPYQWVVKSSI